MSADGAVADPAVIVTTPDAARSRSMESHCRDRVGNGQGLFVHHIGDRETAGHEICSRAARRLTGTAQLDDEPHDGTEVAIRVCPVFVESRITAACT